MKSGRDQMVIDPDPDEIYTKRKKRIVNVMMSSTPSSSPSVKYPNDGWGNSLERMPSFARAEMNQHITNSGKKVASIQHHPQLAIKDIFISERSAIIALLEKGPS